VTAPRQIRPGVVYLITRRCTQREFLLRPSAQLNAIFEFVLAVAGRRYGISLHAYCVMSNHVHLVLTDVYGTLPAFFQYLASLVAKATNSSHGRWESFWAPGSYSAVALETTDDVVEKTAYVLANPVAAGLVKHGRDWPGLWSAPESIGGLPFVVSRPKAYFRARGSMPESATLRLVVPAGFASASDFAAQVREAVAAKEAEAAARLASDGRSFLGTAGVLAQRPTERPAPGEPRRTLSPRVACRDKWKRFEALGRLTTFLCDYREALAAWRKGVRDALFPEGTYLMRIAHGVRCAACG
jgi:REP element-mobilizing transposase RayT